MPSISHGFCTWAGSLDASTRRSLAGIRQHEREIVATSSFSFSVSLFLFFPHSPNRSPSHFLPLEASSPLRLTSFPSTSQSLPVALVVLRPRRPEGGFLTSFLAAVTRAACFGTASLFSLQHPHLWKESKSSSPPLVHHGLSMGFQERRRPE